MPAANIEAKKIEIREGLKKANITDLDKLVEQAVEHASKVDSRGNPVVATFVVSPGFLVSH